MGVAINYEKYRKKRNRYRFTVVLFALFMLGTLTISSAPELEEQISTFQKLHFALANTLHIGGIIASGTNYIILVQSLCTRYNIINSLLKYEMGHLISICLHNFCLQNIFRHHFQNTNFMVLKKDSRQAVISINFIKQLATLHSNLCDTMDTINKW